MKLKNILLMSLSAATLLACNGGASGASGSSSASTEVATLGAQATLATSTGYQVYNQNDPSSYKSGTIVYGITSLNSGKSNGRLYKCKDGPHDGESCSSSPDRYAPGVGWNWKAAWDLYTPPEFVVGTQPDGTACPSGEEVMIDHSSGLMWVQNPKTTSYSWSDAQKSPAIPKSYCGYTDWRSPSEDDLNSIFYTAEHFGVTDGYDEWLNSKGFGTLSNYYWTSHKELKANKQYYYDYYYVATRTGVSYTCQSTQVCELSVWPVREVKSMPTPTPSASPTPTPTASPSPSPTNYLQYPNDISNYNAGTIVYGVKDGKNTPDGKLYKCKAYPYSGWCKGVASVYAPGAGSAWSEAWDAVDDPSPSPTASPKPTPTPTTYAEWNINDVKSYTNGTVVSHKEEEWNYPARKILFKCKVASWCQGDKSLYEPTEGTGWNAAWEIYIDMNNIPDYDDRALYYFGEMVYDYVSSSRFDVEKHLYKFNDGDPHNVSPSHHVACGPASIGCTQWTLVK